MLLDEGGESSLFEAQDVIGPSRNFAARKVFQLIAAVEHRPQSSAAVLADAIEDSILSSGWKAATSIGTTAQLARQFGVGGRTVRQASRMLDARGAIEVRRGKAGGVRVAGVERDVAVAAIRGWLETCDDPGDAVEEAWRALSPTLRGRETAVARLVLDCLGSLRPGAAVDAAPDEPARVRAQQIANRLAHERRPGAPEGEEIRLGSLDELCERYHSGRPVVVQAVRLLEDNDMVSCRRGRAGGVVLHPCGPVAAVRTATAHLASHGATAAEGDELVRAINLAILELATRRMRPGEIERLDAALAQMESGSTPTDVGLGWYLLQRAISHLACSPVLHLLVQCMAGYVVLVRTLRPELADDQARALVEASRTIVANIKRGVFNDSGEAHLRCQDVLMRSW